jgi:hypothetical protein
VATTKATEVVTPHNTDLEEEDSNLPEVATNQLEVVTRAQPEEIKTIKIKSQQQPNLKEAAIPAKEELIPLMEAKTRANGAQTARNQRIIQHNVGQKRK